MRGHSTLMLATTLGLALVAGVARADGADGDRAIPRTEPAPHEHDSRVSGA